MCGVEGSKGNEKEKSSMYGVEWKVPKETKKKRAARILEAAEGGELKLR
jgi:hypothetical protein